MNPRILSFDFGLRRIGLAVGNSITKTSQTLTTIPAKNGQPDQHTVDKVLKEWKPGILVVGLPLSMDGSESTMSRAAREFGETLSRQAGLSVSFVDERLSTKTADFYLRDSVEPGKKITKKLIGTRDNLAAQLILQTYFDEN